MSRNNPFLRKIGYLVIMAALLIPLAALSRPASVDPQDLLRRRPGGKLAELRFENELSQANLGEIDPSGEAIKLATLGMRGVAANILWCNSIHYKKVEDWTSYSATLDQIIKLQPNFVAVWEHQGWNISYNISTEWDDYHDRYDWVMRGIRFLEEGTHYNSHEPRLVWNIGRTISHKIGRSDEKEQFRRLFIEDDDFHGDRAVSRRDSWLVGREYYLEAERMGRKYSLGSIRMNPLLFYSQAPLNLIYYAKALEEEGVFDEKAKLAWESAVESWRQYGNREIPVTVSELGTVSVRLNSFDEQNRKFESLLQQLDDLSPGLRRTIAEERKAALSEEEKKALETPLLQRGTRETEIIRQVLGKLIVSHEDLVARIEGENHEQAVALAEQLAEVQEQLRLTEMARQQCNYAYWLMRSQAELTDDAIEARRHFYLGHKAYRNANAPLAKEEYEAGFAHWRRVIDAFPEMLSDRDSGEEIAGGPILRYERALKQLDAPFPDDFLLQDLMNEHMQQVNFMRGG
jgi:hypothetical protein